VARSVRDVLSQRWVRTEATYDRENPKRVYYLSMEFLIGRSLGNNVTNLLLDPAAKRAIAQRNLDWLGLLEEEPDAGLGNGGLGRLAACFSTRWQRYSCRQWVTGCVTNTVSSSNP
jgi:starch phosphorylase